MSDPVLVTRESPDLAEKIETVSASADSLDAAVKLSGSSTRLYMSAAIVTLAAIQVGCKFECTVMSLVACLSYLGVRRLGVHVCFQYFVLSVCLTHAGRGTSIVMKSFQREFGMLDMTVSKLDTTSAYDIQIPNTAMC